MHKKLYLPQAAAVLTALSRSLAQAHYDVIYPSFHRRRERMVELRDWRLLAEKLNAKLKNLSKRSDRKICE